MHGILVLTYLAVLSAPTEPDSPSRRWPFEPSAVIDLQTTMAVRMADLEQRLAFTFPAGCRPEIRAGLPTSVPEPRRSMLSGVYLSDSTRIYLSESVTEPYRTRDPTLTLFSWLFTPSLNDVLDHELGHAYSDWMSRCTDGRRWPRIDSTSTVPVGLGLMIQSEGISQVFCRGLPDTTFLAGWWPKDLPISSLYPGGLGNTILAYEGGHLLIGDLIRQFGMETTVVYVVTHPLTVNPKRIRRSVVDWHRQAVSDLRDITDTTE